MKTHYIKNKVSYIIDDVNTNLRPKNVAIFDQNRYNCFGSCIFPQTTKRRHGAKRAVQGQGSLLKEKIRTRRLLDGGSDNSCLVEVTGLEPAASCSQSKRATVAPHLEILRFSCCDPADCGSDKKNAAKTQSPNKRVAKN